MLRLRAASWMLPVLWGAPDESYAWTRARMEVFVPAAADWRESVVSKGLNVVQQAMDACFRS
jgi:hypothetical protein